jgi:hypothetical protein
MINNIQHAMDFAHHGEIGQGVSLGPGILSINNSDNELTAEDINSISTIIQNNPMIHSLHLENCILNNLAGNLSALLNTCNIKQLKFKYIKLNSSVVDEISKGITLNTSVESLFFDRVKICFNSDMQTLCNSLCDNITLSKLNFECCNLTSKMIHHLINIAYLRRLAGWVRFEIQQQSLSLKDTTLICLASTHGCVLHTNSPRKINFYYKSVTNCINKAIKSNCTYIDQLILLYQLYHMYMVRKNANISQRNSFKLFIQQLMFKADNKPLSSESFLPVDITRKILSFMPQPPKIHKPQLLSESQVLCRMKMSYSSEF